MRCAKLCSALLLTSRLFADDKVADKVDYTFGTTVVDSSGLQGRVYHLKPKTMELPDFDRMTPVGSIYTHTLNIWPQDFDEGFHNVTERFEWFGIQYTGKIWVEKEGRYRFSLLADDGAKLLLNGKLIINNDGVHSSMAYSGSAVLSRGVHDIKLEYFQGPRYTVSLVLVVAAPGETWRLFNMNDFKPPKDTEQWQKGKISDIQRRIRP